jgi:hypothetical protein
MKHTNMIDQINIEKEIAFELLNRISVIAPSVVLAGGAPRDWDHNCGASDFDYFVSFKDYNSTAFMYRLKSLLNIEITDITNNDPSYYENKWVYSVYELYYFGFKCNLVVYSLDCTSELLDVFPISISKICYMPTFVFKDKKPSLFKHVEYNLGKDYNLVFINDSTKTRYINKVMEKYRQKYTTIHKNV